MDLKNIKLKNIITETVNEYIGDVTYDSLKNETHGLPIVYQLAKSDRIASIFKNGYDREYAGTAGGNFYITGVYTTYNLQSTINNLGDKSNLYGDTIIKLGIKSYERFFIMNQDIAKQVYGDKYRPEDQLKILFQNHPDIYKKIVNSPYYKRIIDTRQHYTSNNVQALLESLGGMQRRSDKYVHIYDINGFVFYGANDGHVAIIKDFKAIVPLAYSKDKGKTWKKDLFSQKTIENSVNTHDNITLLGADIEKYQPQSKFINGAIVIQDKGSGKYNLYNGKKQLSSPYWFDKASPFDNNGKAFVEITFNGKNKDLLEDYITKTKDMYLAHEVLKEIGNEPQHFYIDKNGFFYENEKSKYPINKNKQPLDEMWFEDEEN